MNCLHDSIETEIDIIIEALHLFVYNEAHCDVVKSKLVTYGPYCLNESYISKHRWMK